MKSKEEWTAYNAAHKEEQKLWRARNKKSIAARKKIYATQHREHIAAYQKEYSRKRAAELKKYRAEYFQKNKSRKNVVMAAWKRAHPEAVVAISRRRYLKRKEHILSVNRAWKQANPGKINSYAAKRRAAMAKAMPPWLTEQHMRQIESIYQEARNRQSADGIPRHVDHIYPLMGKTVSGLHVPWNLQILFGEDNLVKSNKMPAGAYTNS